MVLLTRFSAKDGTGQVHGADRIPVERHIVRMDYGANVVHGRTRQRRTGKLSLKAELENRLEAYGPERLEELLYRIQTTGRSANGRRPLPGSRS